MERGEQGAPAGPERIIVNGRWLSKPQTGTGRYSSEILRSLLKHHGAPGVELWVPRDAEIPEWSRGLRVRRFRTRGQLFEQWSLPVRSAGGWLISMGGPAPLLKRRQLAVMHDATPFRLPETYSRTFVTWYRLMYRLLSTRARVPATVSEFSASELAEVTGAPVGRFKVLAPGTTALPLPQRPNGRLPQRFLLMVGTLAPHKNFGPTVSVLVEAGYSLVIVGDLEAAAAFGRASMLDHPDVVRVGRVTDAELAWLYGAAEALIFPSLYEGFGLPVLEAQSCGCPVVSSDRASLVEVLQESGEFFDPEDSKSLLAAVSAVWDSPEARSRLRARGYENVKRFQWSSSAEEMIASIISSNDEQGDCSALSRVWTEGFSRLRRRRTSAGRSGGGDDRGRS